MTCRSCTRSRAPTDGTGRSSTPSAYTRSPRSERCWSTCRSDDRRKGGTMDDAEVLGRINELAREEHELFERESHGKVTDADRDRLRRLQVTLDQCWDLLRQRRARRAAGGRPPRGGGAAPRDQARGRGDVWGGGARTCPSGRGGGLCAGGRV